MGAHAMKKPVDVLQVWVIYHAFSTHMSMDVHEMIGLLLMLLQYAHKHGCPWDGRTIKCGTKLVDKAA